MSLARQLALQRARKVVALRIGDAFEGALTNERDIPVPRLRRKPHDGVSPLHRATEEEGKVHEHYHGHPADLRSNPPDGESSRRSGPTPPESILRANQKNDLSGEPRLARLSEVSVQKIHPQGKRIETGSRIISTAKRRKLPRLTPHSSPFSSCSCSRHMRA